MSVTVERRLLPTFRAEDISWRRKGEWLVVSIEMTNESSEPTGEGDLVIEAAELGAFVPFVPVGRVKVTAFEPFERRRVTATVPVAEAGWTMPSDEWSDAQTTPASDSIDAEVINRFYANQDVAQWAGNLNVYFDRTPQEAVEVHRALDVRVEAGSTIQFMFLVAADQMVMSAVPSAPGWTARTQARLFVGLLSVQPPDDPGLRATIDVHVTRVPDQQTVKVTFGLETVIGPGGSIGCVRI